MAGAPTASWAWGGGGMAQGAGAKGRSARMPGNSIRKFSKPPLPSGTSVHISSFDARSWGYSMPLPIKVGPTLLHANMEQITNYAVRSTSSTIPGMRGFEQLAIRLRRYVDFATREDCCSCNAGMLQCSSMSVSSNSNMQSVSDNQQHDRQSKPTVNMLAYNMCWGVGHDIK